MRVVLCLVLLFNLKRCAGTLPTFYESIASTPELLSPTPPQLFCGDEMPTLLNTDKSTDKESLQQYYTFYRRRQRRLRAAEQDGVELVEITGSSKFRVLRAIGLNGNMVYCDGWNETHSMPSHVSASSSSPQQQQGEGGGVTMGSALVWAQPPANRHALKCDKAIGRGRLLVVANWFPGNFGHFVHDTLPLVLWLQRFAGLQPSDRFGLVDDWLHRTIVRWLDPALSARVVWLSLGQVNCLEAGTLVAVQYAKAQAATVVGAATGSLGRRAKQTSVWELRNPSLFRAFSLEVDRLLGARQTKQQLGLGTGLLGTSAGLPAGTASGTFPHGTTSSSVSSVASSSSPIQPPRTVLFYSRRSSRSTLHGRVMPEKHEAEVLEVVRASMRKWGRREALVVFNGEDEEGRKLSYETQLRTFRRASLVIGPHGSGLANVVWMQPASSSSVQQLLEPGADDDDRYHLECEGGGEGLPAVLEFIADEATSQAGVQPGNSGKSYFSLLGGAPWVRYYHLFLNRNSTNAAIFVDGPTLEAALGVVWRNMVSPPLLPSREEVHQRTQGGLSLASSSSALASLAPPPSGAKVGIAEEATNAVKAALQTHSPRKSMGPFPESFSKKKSSTSEAAAAAAADSQKSDDASSLNGGNTVSLLNDDNTVLGVGRGGFVFVLATHKTGSTFLWKVFNGLAQRSSNPCIIDGEKGAGLPETSEDLLSRCPSREGILFTRKLPSPALMRKVSNAMAALAPPPPLQTAQDTDTTATAAAAAAAAPVGSQKVALPNKNCRGVFHTRNPYDVAVSQYQSFTKNHAIPRSILGEARDAEVAKRAAQRAQGVNAYALAHWREIKWRLDQTRASANLFKAAGCEVMSSLYEDMTARPEDWAREVGTFLGILAPPGGSSPLSLPRPPPALLAPPTPSYSPQLQEEEEKNAAAYSSPPLQQQQQQQQQWDFLRVLASQQRKVVVNDSTHTAYFFPGAHLRLLSNATLSWLY